MAAMVRVSWAVSLQLLVAGVSLGDSFSAPRPLPVPAQLDAARDLRIVGDRSRDEIALLVDDGLWATRVDPHSEAGVRLLAPAGPGSGGPWAAASAALEQFTVAIGAPVLEIVVRRAAKPPVRVWVEGVFDIDVRDGALAVFGVARVEDRMAPDGAIAFVVAPGSDEPKPVLLAASGPGAPATAGCHTSRAGALRFAPDGGLLVAPSTEPGVHLLDREFRPQQVWTGELLPTGPRCPRTEEERLEYGLSPRTRFQVLNSVPTIEEVFFAGGDPWVVIRSSAEQVVSWHAVRLLPDGSLRRVELGLPQGTEFTRLKADASDHSLVVLTYEEPPDARIRGARLYDLQLQEEKPQPTP